MQRVLFFQEEISEAKINFVLNQVHLYWIVLWLVLIENLGVLIESCWNLAIYLKIKGLSKYQGGEVIVIVLVSIKDKQHYGWANTEHSQGVLNAKGR